MPTEQEQVTELLAANEQLTKKTNDLTAKVTQLEGLLVTVDSLKKQIEAITNNVGLVNVKSDSDKLAKLGTDLEVLDSKASGLNSSIQQTSKKIEDLEKNVSVHFEQVNNSIQSLVVGQPTKPSTILINLKAAAMAAIGPRAMLDTIENVATLAIKLEESN